METTNKTKVLIADDNKFYSKTIGDFFKDNFLISTSIASDEKVFLANVETFLPDIIIYDVYTSPCSINLLIKKVHQKSENSKFVALSFEIEEEFVSFCMEAGAVGFVEKSIGDPELIIGALKNIALGKTIVLTTQTA